MERAAGIQWARQLLWGLGAGARSTTRSSAPCAVVMLPLHPRQFSLIRPWPIGPTPVGRIAIGRRAVPSRQGSGGRQRGCPAVRGLTTALRAACDRGTALDRLGRSSAAVALIAAAGRVGQREGQTGGAQHG